MEVYCGRDMGPRKISVYRGLIVTTHETQRMRRNKLRGCGKNPSFPAISQPNCNAGPRG